MIGSGNPKFHAGGPGGRFAAIEKVRAPLLCSIAGLGLVRKSEDATVAGIGIVASLFISPALPPPWSLISMAAITIVWLTVLLNRWRFDRSDLVDEAIAALEGNSEGAAAAAKLRSLVDHDRRGAVAYLRSAFIASQALEAFVKESKGSRSGAFRF